MTQMNTQSSMGTRFAPSGLTTKKSTTMNRSGRNMLTFAVRNLSVMTFQCERLIEHYKNIQRVEQQNEEP